MKKTFILKSNWIEIFDNLSDKQAGLLIKSLFNYNVKGEKPADLTDKEVNAYFNMMLLDCKEFTEKYDRRCETSSENGKMGGRPRKPNKPNSKPNNLSKPNCVNDNDNDSPLPPSGKCECDSENRNPYPMLTPEVAKEFEEYKQSLRIPLNDYQCKLKIGELLQITDQPKEQLLILRHTTANSWKKLVPPKDVEEAILARRFEEELKERQEAQRIDGKKRLAEWKKKLEAHQRENGELE